MKILIDECIDQRFRGHFVEHYCETAAYAGFAGLKNGALLTAAEAAGFDVIVTVDQNMPFQQNLSGRRIAVVVLCSSTNRLVHLQALVPSVWAALAAIAPGEVVRVSE